MFLPKEIAEIIADLFQQADRECRIELRDGIIVDESGYMERLVGKIRDMIARFLGLYIHAQTLPGGLEQFFGADSIFIFKYKEQIKIGLAEAKWPRASRGTAYKWDSEQESSGHSHFSDQLLRQRNWQDLFAIWEMFLFEGASYEQHPPFHENGSSCVLHQDAITHMRDLDLVDNLWNTAHLLPLLRYQRKSFGYIIFSILMCKYGRALSYNTVFDPSTNSINVGLNNVSRSIPLPGSITRDSNANSGNISSFMKENGLTGYIYMDFGNTYR